MLNGPPLERASGLDLDLDDDATPLEVVADDATKFALSHRRGDIAHHSVQVTTIKEVPHIPVEIIHDDLVVRHRLILVDRRNGLQLLVQ